MPEKCRIGVISDTHGLLRPAAIEALQGSTCIIHAGDIGKQEILEALQAIAPLTVVRGNIDTQSWAQVIPKTEAVKVCGNWLYVMHNLQELDLDPAVAGFRWVISGHSHQPACVEREGVLYINPGSAGPRRFKLPVCLVYISIKPGKTLVRLVDLETGLEKDLI